MRKTGIQRGAVDLREILFETLDGLREGKIKPRDAKAVCEVAGKIIESVGAEITEVRIMQASIALQRQMTGESPALRLVGGDE